ncbi:peptidoglycan-binding protein [Candidatus Kaiserbacteria bacterium]|nr:peptidoglycan-binding protein [Candidatus Kaiserbacteria bacterium]
MTFVRNSALSLILAGVVLMGASFMPQVSRAETLSIDDMLALIQDLLTQVEDLQKQINTVRGEIKALIRDGLKEGMTDEDIEKIQEILASDPSIYPEGYVTGYFGPLTRSALRRFQEKFELEVNGEVDEETRAALETLLEARFGEGQVPPGLLRAPGIQKKFELRLKDECDNSGSGKDPFCREIRVKYHFDDDDKDDDSDDDDEDDDSDDDNDEDEDSDDD